ncbi:MAG: amidohydrolase family protein [Anaerolineae bacterium]|nr:amidohydrolase family protein [Anaerolineae bacterium]MCO5203973.1 amidohydrolase family protein [Anaerolineae bacterium]
MSITLIHNGTVIDGNGGAPLTDGAVLVEDNTIRAIGRKSTLHLPNKDITTVDANGGTILPGFIDTHVHVMLDNPNLFSVAAAPFSLHYYNSVNSLRRTIDAGITSVRDAGGADLGTKMAVEKGIVVGPRMQISISVLSITGGHVDGWLRSGSTLSFFPETPGRPGGICDGIDGVRTKVRQVLRAGADVIKICATGGVLSPTDHPDFTQFSPEELDVIVREAGYRGGIKVMAHAQGLEGIKNAIRAGVHSIEHGIFLDDEAVEMMIARGIFLVPTLLAPVAVVESADSLPDYAREQAMELMEIHSESIAKAYHAGVKIAMGTDAGVMPHGTNLRELELMVNVGMTPMDAIIATTRTAAECLGWQDKVGTLEPGKLADIIVTDIDPLTDIGALADNDHIRFVMKDGAIVKQ